MIDMNSLTKGEVKQTAALLGIRKSSDDSHWPIGRNIFIRTVTHHHTGKLVKVTEHELVLENAAWIADDGRLTDTLKTGDFSEVEMFPKEHTVIIGRAAIIDATEITTIPISQK